VYCDVLCYGSQSGPNVTILPKCLVSQERAGIQSGDIWRPRAATMDISGAPLSLAHSSPQNLDGDHVLVGFMDDIATAPVILRSLPHPRADLGQAAAEPADGQAMRLRLIDGSPDLRKHHGSVAGFTDAADFVVRTTYANTGALTAMGAPPGPPKTGDVGNVLLQLHKRAQRLTQLVDMDAPQAPVEALKEVLQAMAYELEFVANAAHWSVSDASGNTVEARKGGPAATLKVGDGSSHVAIAEQLQVLYTALVAAFNSHTHNVLLTPTSPPLVSLPPNAAAPAWSSSIASSKVSIPTG
jgi:hypothetical protein